MSAYDLYKIELEKLRQLAAKRDWSYDGELAFIRQLNQTKRAYLAACQERVA
jgi:hypothetical protein